MGRRARGVAGGTLALSLAACTAPGSPAGPTPDPTPEVTTTDAAAGMPEGEVTLAFAGDVHFEGQVAQLLDPGRSLGPIRRTLSAADIAMVNLESPVTQRGTQDPKELERADNRFHFRTSPRALGVLAESGVDVVSVANNHVGDYGRVGLTDTLAAGRRGPVAVVGIGRDGKEAFTPHVARVGELDVAFLGADAVKREGSSGVWAAGPDNAGLAAARGRRTDRLVTAVEDAADRSDLVVVYMHWGRENQACPTQTQRLLVRNLAEAGADVVLGSHTHVLGGAGWAGDTYVSYGLGNFVWYHDRQPDTGVLTLRLDADGVVEDRFTPARISPADGRPLPVTGAARDAAVQQWRDKRRCTGLAARPGGSQTEDPAYAASVSAIDDDLAARMRGTSHRPGCPVALADLRHLEMTYRDFEGRARTGEMIVHRRWAREVTRVFGRLYESGWPIARMRLIEEYGGNDDRSMAANNSSGFNCRPVAGQTSWSAHAFGAAIDVNPVQNPYLRPGTVDPPAGRPFAQVDRSGSAPVAQGVIRTEDVVVTELARLGWDWGGYWASPDYQHFAARELPPPSPAPRSAPRPAPRTG